MCLSVNEFMAAKTNIPTSYICRGVSQTCYRVLLRFIHSMSIQMEENAETGWIQYEGVAVVVFLQSVLFEFIIYCEFHHLQLSVRQCRKTYIFIFINQIKSFSGRSLMSAQHISVEKGKQDICQGKPFHVI